MIQLKGQVGLDDVDAAVAALRKAALAGTVELDLREVRGMDRAAGPLLTKELFTSTGTAHVVVRAPEHNRDLLLAQSGLLFFLADDSAREVIPPFQQAASLNPWRTTWTRGSGAQKWLFDDAQAIEPTTFRRGEYAAFVNPHLVGRPFGQSDLSGIVQPWLAQFFPPGIHLNRLFLQDISDIIDELLSNVCDHAASQERLPELRSLVLVTLARGKESDARYRVHLSVLDTGVGVVTSAKVKVNGGTEASADLLRDLFEHRGLIRHARGFGLPHIWQKVSNRSDGRLYCTTDGFRLEGKANFLKVASLPHGATGGTVVTVTFPAPSLSHI